MNLRRLASASAAALVLAASGGCTNGGGGDEPSGGIPGIQVTGEVGTAPELTFDAFEIGDEVVSEVVVEGEGPTWSTGGFAVVHLYAGNATTGSKSFSSYDSGEPQLVKLDPAQFVGPEFAERLDGAAEGSRVVVASSVPTLVGEEGATSAGLGPEDDVVFVVDVLRVALQPEGESEALPKGAPEPVIQDGIVSGVDFSDAAAKPAKKLQVIPLIEGKGREVESGEQIVVRYRGVVYGEEEPFDETYSRPTPATFEIGTGGLIKAWDRALVGLKAGTRVLLVVPPSVGYGAAGSPPSIPGGATLVFVIDVLASFS